MTEQKMNVESFNLDHTKVRAPYVRLADIKTGDNGDCIHKYDMRICQPNQAHMEMPALHSLEHLLAELSPTRWLTSAPWAARPASTWP